jgi:hypothetical protein
MAAELAESFSPIDGGPTLRLMRRLARKKPEHLVYRAAIVCALVAWLPLAVMTIVEGFAWGDRVTMPFFFDVASYARFLIAIPLFVIAESVISPRLGDVARHFLFEGRISDAELPAYEDAIERGIKMRESGWGEAIILVITYVSAASLLVALAPGVSNWRFTTVGAETVRTTAAWWYALVSVPLFQFLAYRWLFRLFIWGLFLYRVSRLNLKLIPTHPDKAGGIGFIGSGQRFFWIIAFAIGTALSGIWANSILYEGTTITSLRTPIVSIMIIVVIVLQFPIIFFAGKLRRTRRIGYFIYSDLALNYTTQFHQKWIEGKNPEGEALLGSGDIQSLADLGNSFQMIEKMWVIPFDLKACMRLAVAFIVPVIPLLLTVMPLDEIIQTLLKMVT